MGNANMFYPQMPMYGSGMPNMINVNLLENRISALEADIRRLESRINKIENPYSHTNMNTEEYNYNPYQSSMQMM